jgi:hypothetical protein
VWTLTERGRAVLITLGNPEPTGAFVRAVDIAPLIEPSTTPDLGLDVLCSTETIPDVTNPASPDFVPGWKRPLSSANRVRLAELAAFWGVDEDSVLNVLVAEAYRAHYGASKTQGRT